MQEEVDLRDWIEEKNDVRKEIRDEDIRVLVESLKELGVAREQIIHKIVEKYGLDTEKANIYVNC